MCGPQTPVEPVGSLPRAAPSLVGGWAGCVQALVPSKRVEAHLAGPTLDTLHGALVYVWKQRETRDPRLLSEP